MREERRRERREEKVCLEDLQLSLNFIYFFFQKAHPGPPLSLAKVLQKRCVFKGVFTE
jgi:hypothetical protein